MRLCQVAGFLGTMFYTTSTSILMTVALDRYFIITRKIFCTHPSPKRYTICGIVLGWLLGFLVVVPTLFGFGQFGYNETTGLCGYRMTTGSQHVQKYQMVPVAFAVCLPTPVISFCYTAIYRQVNRRKVAVDTLQSIPMVPPMIKEIKIAKDLLIVFGAYFFCNLPYGLAITVNLMGVELSGRLYRWASLFLVLNPVCNPIIYAARIQTFRKAFKHIILLRFRALTEAM
ncbi:melanopsin-like [Ptychodera flava]|uniref:melanopsin-like n=1 Tax=Ptychodera flava TaxID=63121 RepID=UPI00396A4E23